jgi:hypothetical protein
VTTTDSAKVTPATGGTVGVHTAERALTGARVPAAVRAERKAWLVIWVAFATFCALIFAISKFAVDYVSSAEVNQAAAVKAARGQVVLSLPGSAEKTLLGTRNELTVGTVLWLDRTTSADVQLFDGSRIKLQGGATLELSRMEVGRFINQHAVVLTQTSGPVRYATGDAVDVIVPEQGVVHLAPHGDYTVWLDGDRTRVLVYGGEARVSGNAGAALNVPEGHRTEIDRKGQLSQVNDLATPLLTNPDFGQRSQGWQELDAISGIDVNGTREWVTGPDTSTEALRVWRKSVKGEHGETGLVQPLDRDVSGFRHLWLQAWVRVDYADLSGGGTFGSEFPMMFRMKYEGPVEGSLYPWAIGMYYANPENRTIPPNSAVLWTQGQWDLYRQDLMETDDPSRVPYRLLEFAVEGQGHSYDARVAGISLIGE